MARAGRFKGLINDWTAQEQSVSEQTPRVQHSEDMYISDTVKDTHSSKLQVKHEIPSEAQDTLKNDIAVQSMKDEYSLDDTKDIYDSKTKDTHLSKSQIADEKLKVQNTTTDTLSVMMKDVYDSDMNDEYVLDKAKDIHLSGKSKGKYSSRPEKKHRNFKVPRVLKDCRVNFLTRPALYENLKAYARQQKITAGEAINRILTAFLEQHQA